MSVKTGVERTRVSNWTENAAVMNPSIRTLCPAEIDLLESGSGVLQNICGHPWVDWIARWSPEMRLENPFEFRELYKFQAGIRLRTPMVSGTQENPGAASRFRDEKAP